MDTTTGQNVRTAHGTIHRLIVGATYGSYGDIRRNHAGRAAGKAVCGARTSMAARVVDAPVTCPKCLAL